MTTHAEVLEAIETLKNAGAEVETEVSTVIIRLHVPDAGTEVDDGPRAS
jgi:hypothetical protein